jgi:hypothetical protein
MRSAIHPERAVRPEPAPGLLDPRPARRPATPARSQASTLAARTGIELAGDPGRARWSGGGPARFARIACGRPGPASGCARCMLDQAPDAPWRHTTAAGSTSCRRGYAPVGGAPRAPSDRAGARREATSSAGRYAVLDVPALAGRHPRCRDGRGGSLPVGPGGGDRAGRAGARWPWPRRRRGAGPRVAVDRRWRRQAARLGRRSGPGRAKRPTVVLVDRGLRRLGLARPPARALFMDWRPRSRYRREPGPTHVSSYAGVRRAAARSTARGTSLAGGPGQPNAGGLRRRLTARWTPAQASGVAGSRRRAGLLFGGLDAP